MRMKNPNIQWRDVFIVLPTENFMNENVTIVKLSHSDSFNYTFLEQINSMCDNNIISDCVQH